MLKQIIQTTENFVCIIFLVILFNGISTYVGYFMPKPFFKKNSSATI